MCHKFVFRTLVVFFEHADAYPAEALISRMGLISRPPGSSSQPAGPGASRLLKPVTPGVKPGVKPVHRHVKPEQFEKKKLGLLIK